MSRRGMAPRIRPCPSPKTRPTSKPCYMRALANEANQLKSTLRVPADCHVTQRYVPPHSASPGLPNPVAIDMETRALGPHAFLANHSYGCLNNSTPPDSDGVPIRRRPIWMNVADLWIVSVGFRANRK